MLQEVSGDIEVLAVAARSVSRAFAAQLDGRDGLTVETAADPDELPSRLDSAAVDCLVTDHDPPAVDALTSVEVAIDADIPALVVGTAPYTALDCDPFEAGASEYHRLRGEDGEPALAHRRIEQAVERDRSQRETEALAETLLEVTDSAMGIVDSDGVLRQVNDRALAFAGLLDADDAAVGEPYRKTPWTTRTSASPADVDAAIEQALSGETVSFDITARDRHSNLIEVDTRFRPIEVGNEAIGLVVMGAETTKLRTTSRRLRVLSRVLRHDLRNSLVAINGHAEFVEAGTGGETRTHAEKIQQLADDLVDKAELARRVEQALSINRQPIPTVDIVDVLEPELDRLEDDHPDVEIERSLPDDCLVMAEHGIDIAIRALVDNALEHNDADTPRLIVGIERGTVPDGTVGPDALSETVTVSIADNGPGMPAHELEVLENGIETDLEHTSGLGLWAANWIVADSGGHLDFVEPPAGGTEVRITLPAASDDE